MPDSDWHLDALCAQVDPELFFPEMGHSVRKAKSICANCTVRQPCLEQALDNKERFGVWGGTSPAERLVMLRERQPGFVWVETPVRPEDKSRGGPWSSDRTHCNRGHELTPENVMYVSKGRRCRECKRMADARRRRTQRELDTEHVQSA